jgi:hypothetical protein
MPSKSAPTALFEIRKKRPDGMTLKETSSPCRKKKRRIPPIRDNLSDEGKRDEGKKERLEKKRRTE